MATGLDFKVYKGRELLATVRYAEDAAALAAVTLNAVIKYAGRIVWREDREEFSAGDSYDKAASVMWGRIDDHRAERARKDALIRARAAATA